MAPTAAPEYAEFTESSTVRNIPLGRLVPSTTNPRKHVNEAQLRELAADVALRGVLQPLRVRPTAAKNGGLFEIVFGERRYRAATIAQLETAPCVIGEMSDLEALELQIAENLQRADMTPLEEADAFARLQRLDPKYLEPKVLAHQVGKSEKTIRERLRLLTLIPDARAALDAEEITLGHASLIAQLEAKAQPAALKECFYPLYGGTKGERELRPLRDVERWFESNVILDLEHEAVPELFPELAGEVAKTQAAGGEIVRVTRSWQAPKPRKGEPPILNSDQFKEAKASDPCGVAGVVVLGRERGSILRICVDKTCKKHWPAPRHAPTSSGAKASGAKVSTAERKKEAERRKREQAAQARAEEKKRRAERVQARAIREVGSSIDALSPAHLRLLLDQQAEYVDFNREGAVAKVVTEITGIKFTSFQTDKKSIAAVPAAKVPAAIIVLLLANQSGAYQADRFAKMIAPFKVDLKKIDAAVLAEEKAAAASTAAAAKATKPATKAKRGKKR